MKCPICDIEFRPKRSDAKTCGKEACRKTLQRRSKVPPLKPTKNKVPKADELFENYQPNYYRFGDKTIERKCITCGITFKTTLPFMRFCSPKCQTQALTDLNKQMLAKGLSPVIRGAEVPKVEFISSGIKEIDDITGGFPRRRITELFGMKGVGKTTLMSRVINALPDLRIYYVDTENALSEVPANVDFVNEYMLERVSEAVELALQKSYDLIVIDSVASISPRAEIEGDAGENQFPIKAKLMSQWMRRINPGLAKSDTAVVFINQQRESPNMYVPKYTPGGLALPYAASLRLELKTTKADRFEGGHLVHVEVEKSRVCRPYQKTKFKLFYT